MKGWTARGDRPVFEAVTGVSTGALAAPFVFLGPAHDQDLADIYLNNGTKQLYTSRGLYGLLGQLAGEHGATGGADPPLLDRRFPG